MDNGKFICMDSATKCAGLDNIYQHIVCVLEASEDLFLKLNLTNVQINCKSNANSACNVESSQCKNSANAAQMQMQMQQYKMAKS